MKSSIEGVSIVLTSYNYGAYISRALASACAQFGSEIEIIVVDNASTDDSWQIIEAWARRDDRIRAFRNDENIGMIGNHVRGLSLATKERVLFLSADDYLLPGHVARLLAAHAEHPEIDYFFTTYAHVDENDRFTRYLGHIGHLRGSYFGGRNEFADLLTYDCYMCTPTTLFDREEMISSGGFDPNVVCGDLEAYLRLSGNGARFGFLDTVGVAVRMHASESGRERYVATGKQLLDHIYLLERYLQPQYEPLLHWHENGIARLLQAKINNLSEYPIATEIMHREQGRINAIAARLNQLVSHTAASMLSGAPAVSVVVLGGDDISGLEHIRSQLEKQSYQNWELVVAAQGMYDASPLVADRAGERSRIITYRTPHSRAQMLNDAARLAHGEIVTYLDPTVTWPENHLQRIVTGLSDPRISAMSVPVDLLVVRAGAIVANYESFTGGALAAEAGRTGEAVPLVSLAHRRGLFDQVGLFEEALNHLVDCEFVQRILSRGPLGIDDGGAVQQRISYDVLHPCLADPNAYMASLRAIYNGRPVDAALSAKREAHFNHLANELRAMGGAPDTTRAHFFTAMARGGTPRRPHEAGSGKKHVLVIDDCVPYAELGRGYPRARTVIEELRDAGYDVTFYPLVRPYDDPALNYGIEGVRILYGNGPELLGLTLDAMLDRLDLLWVSRPHNMRDVRAILDIIDRPLPPIVYDAEAVYVERERVRAEIEGREVLAGKHAEAVARELQYAAGCAVVSAVSAGERELIATQYDGQIQVLSFSIEPNPTPAPFGDRSGILFVGAIEPDSPNDDALWWFATNVSSLLPLHEVRHAGVMSSQRLSSAAVTFLGVVPDLRPIYNAARVFIAPTRFAAGLPQKVYEAAANGIPIVASALIARQLGWEPERDLLVAESPEEWAAALKRLTSDEALWNRLRRAGLDRVQAEVAPDAFRAAVLKTAALALSSERRMSHA